MQLTDNELAHIAPLTLGKPGDPGAKGKDNRNFIEGVLWILRTGAPWRDLPIRRLATRYDKTLRSFVGFFEIANLHVQYVFKFAIAIQ